MSRPPGLGGQREGGDQDGGRPPTMPPGPRTREADLHTVIAAVLPELAEVVDCLRAATERTPDDLAARRDKEAAAQAVTEAYVEYRRLADASKALDATPAGGQSP